MEKYNTWKEGENREKEACTQKQEPPEDLE